MSFNDSRLTPDSPPPAPTEWRLHGLDLRKGMVRISVRNDLGDHEVFNIRGAEAGTLLGQINSGDFTVVPLASRVLTYLDQQGYLSGAVDESPEPPPEPEP